MQAPLPPWAVQFASVPLFAAIYNYLNGAGVFEGDPRSGVLRGCGQGTARAERTGPLCSLQSHGQQEEGDSPAGRSQEALASSTWLSLRAEEYGVEREGLYKSAVLLASST